MDVLSKPLGKMVNKKDRALEVVKRLKKNYPQAKCSLNYRNPLQLLMATMLSAQCTDERVNKTTPALFKKYKTAKAFASASQAELEDIVRPTGFFRNKAKNIIACNKELVKEHKGVVPSTMDELHALSGVGRKTANVVLGNAFGIPGMVVDTHVTRLSNRLGLAKGKDAVKLEYDLQKLVPEKDWTDFGHLMIEHGRAICKARKAECDECFLSDICPKKGL
jgi:endonuclease-3